MIFRGMIFLLLENCDLKNLPFRGARGLSSLVNPWQNGNVRFSEPTLFQACYHSGFIGVAHSRSGKNAGSDKGRSGIFF